MSSMWERGLIGAANTTRPLIGRELREALKDRRQREQLFRGLWLREATRRQIASSLMAGRHLLLLGPPGSGKSRLCRNLGSLLPPLTTLRDCPVHCTASESPCPWCASARVELPYRETIEITGPERLVRVIGDGALQWEDLLGDLDPVRGMHRGRADVRSFVPGKLLRANRGILVLDQVESIPQRTLNALLQTLDDGAAQLGFQDEPLPLDLLVIGTGSVAALERLSVNLLDHFDLVQMEYPRTPGERWEQLLLALRESGGAGEMGRWGAGEMRGKGDGEQGDWGEFSPGTPLPSSSLPPLQPPAPALPRPPALPLLRRVVGLADRIARHPAVERGVSPRGTLRCLELLRTLPWVEGRETPDFDDFRQAALLSFPHRLRLKGGPFSQADPVELVRELIDQELADAMEADGSARGQEKLSQLALELARNRDFNHPLRWGHRGLLLRRIKNQPQSHLAQLYQEMRDELKERWARGEQPPPREDRFLHEMEWLEELEGSDGQERRLEEEALRQTLDLLEEWKLLQRDGDGWAFHRQGVRRLLDELLPPDLGRWKALSSLRGRHRQPIPAPWLPHERLPEARKYRKGDRYRDLALRATLREAIRRKRETIQPADLRVYRRGRTSRLDIMLALDLSGTMRQGDKLWHAKEAMGALAIACSFSGDRIGLVTFSNLATPVLAPVTDPILLMEKLVDLWIRRNAFTNIGHALKTARESCLRHRLATTVPHVILISDGQATAPPSDPRGSALQEAVLTRRHEITISSICLVHGSSDVEMMRRISQIGRGRLHLVHDTRSLPQVMLQERRSL